MYEQIISLAGSLLRNLHSLKLRKSKQKAVAQKLTDIHNSLRDVVENGKTILSLCRKRNKGQAYNPDELLNLVNIQHQRLKEILNALRRDDIDRLLNLHNPGLVSRINMKVSLKSHLGYLFLLHALKETENNLIISLRDTAESYSSDDGLLNETSIRQRRRELKRIEELTEELRAFVISNFTIEDVL